MYLIYIKIYSIIFLSTLLRGEENDVYSDCKPVYTHDYGYRIYFHLPKSAMLPNKTIYFPFSVQTSSDAHILLTTSVNPSNSDPAYQIVLGGGMNTFSEVRRIHHNRNGYSTITKNIVNKNAVKKFWIKIEDGDIQVGEDQGVTPFMHWRDDSPLNISFISFSSWHATVAKWYFDCWGVTPITPNKTATEKLKNSLFEKYDPYTIPTSDDDTIIINSNLTINYINLDPSSSSMELIGMLETYWEDNMLKWDPRSYDNIEFIRITNRDVWQPAFLLYNGATVHQKWFDQGVITVTKEGMVDWSSPIHLITRCNLKMSDWPRDVHVCRVVIGLHSDQHSVHLDSFTDITLTRKDAGIWEILSVEGSMDYMKPPWEEALDQSNTVIDSTSVIILEISLRRYSSTYYYLLFVPLKVTMIISVISFCLSHALPQRIFIQVIVLILYVINLLSIDSLLPTPIKETPHILKLNSLLLMVATICTILTVWLVQCSRMKEPMKVPAVVQRLINYISIRINIFTQNNGKRLMNFEDEEEEVEEEGTKETGKNSNKTDMQHWQAYLILIDYLLLFIILISYLILLLAHTNVF